MSLISQLGQVTGQHTLEKYAVPVQTGYQQPQKPVSPAPGYNVNTPEYRAALAIPKLKPLPPPSLVRGPMIAQNRLSRAHTVQTRAGTAPKSTPQHLRKNYGTPAGGGLPHTPKAVQ